MRRRDFLINGFGGVLATGALAIRTQAEDQPKLDIIDAHTHFYDPTRPQGVPWPGKNDLALYRPILPDEFRKLAEPHGVVGTVVVEASPWVEDNMLRSTWVNISKTASADSELESRNATADISVFKSQVPVQSQLTTLSNQKTNRRKVQFVSSILHSSRI